MRYADSKGLKYPRWDVNEQLLAGDLNALAQFTYQNHTDMLASFVESAIGDVSTGGKNVLLNGLKVSISGDDLEITPGMSLSYFGAYFDPVSGAFAFQTSTVGQAFSAVLPESGTIAAFVTSDVVSGMESRGNVEIRPVITLYDEQQRSFIDPNSAVVSNSAINVKGFFGAQLRIRYGTPAAANSVAPSEVNDWIKIGEIFVDNDGSTAVVDYADWTTGSNNFISLADELAQADIPYATRATPGLVEQATDNEFDNSDTTRYATPLQIQTALETLRTTLQATIDAIPDPYTDSDLPIASTTQQGIVERVTQTEFNNRDSTRYVTAALVLGMRDALLDSPPGALDTLNELAAALGDDANFSATIMSLINNRLQRSNNLSDLQSVSSARTNLGLGAVALLSSLPNATEAIRGIIERANQTEGEGGTDNERAMTSLRTRQHGDVRYLRQYVNLGTSLTVASGEEVSINVPGGLSQYTTVRVFKKDSFAEILVSSLESTEPTTDFLYGALQGNLWKLNENLPFIADSLGIGGFGLSYNANDRKLYFVHTVSPTGQLLKFSTLGKIIDEISNISIGASSVGLAIDASGNAFILSNDEILKRIDLATGIVTNIGTGIGAFDTGGYCALSFHNGLLYGMAENIAKTAIILFRVNTTTGAATSLGNSYSIYSGNGVGLASYMGSLWAKVGDESIRELNVVTGAQTGTVISRGYPSGSSPQGLTGARIPNSYGSLNCSIWFPNNQTLRLANLEDDAVVLENVEAV